MESMKERVDYLEFLSALLKDSYLMERMMVLWMDKLKVSLMVML